MPTPAEEAFAARIDELLAQVGQLDEAGVRRAAGVVNDVRRSIAASLANVDPDSFTASHLLAVRSEVVTALQQLAERVGLLVDELLEDAAGLGDQMGSLGAGAGPSRRMLEVLQGYSATLIQNLGSHGRRQVDAVLARATLGAITPHQAIRLIAGELPSRSVFQSLALRAEAIVRTEVNRAFSVASQARMAEVAKTAPGLKKRWVTVGDSRVRASHQSVSGQVVGVNERFSVNGYAASYPRDPALPAKETVNCRCHAVPVVDDEVLKQAGVDPPEAVPIYPTSLRSQAELLQAADTLSGAASSVSGLRSTYNGQARISFTLDAAAKYEWDNSLSVHGAAFLSFTDAELFRVLVHEMAHAISVGATKKVFPVEWGLEEGVVEMWAKTFASRVARAAGAPFKAIDWAGVEGAYRVVTVRLERIRKLAGQTPSAFYGELIGVPLGRRAWHLLQKAPPGPARDEIRSILESLP